MHFRIPGLSQIIGQQSFVYRDKLRRLVVEQTEVDRMLYKAMTRDASLPLDVRLDVQRLFETALPRDSSATRVKNRCALTGRSKGVYRDFRLSRLMFRKLAHAGLLNGVTKSSW